MVVGKPELFAVEYSVEQRITSVFGKIRLWFAGEFVGAYEDIVPLGATLTQLDSIASASREGPMSVDARNFHRMVFEDSPELKHEYRIALGESFDDFLMACCGQGDCLLFTWELIEHPFFCYPQYPEGIHSASVGKEYFARVIEMSWSKLRSDC